MLFIYIYVSIYIYIINHIHIINIIIKYTFPLLLYSIAKVVHAMRGRGHRGDLSGLMLSLGAGPQDRKLLDAWSMGLPSNPA